MIDIRVRLLEAFREEHREYLTGMRSFLAGAERGEVAGPALDEVFRQAHSLKAAARACDFLTVEAIGQRLETLFSRMRKGTLSPGADVLKTLGSVLTSLEGWAAGLGQESSLKTPPEPAEAVAVLDHLLEGGAVAASAPQTAKPPEMLKTPAPAEEARRDAAADDLNARLLAAFQVEHKEHLEGIRSVLAGVERQEAPAGTAIDEAFRRAHSLKGAARLAEMGPVEAVAHKLETLFTRVREGKLQLTVPVVRAIHLGLDAIEDWAAALYDKRTPGPPDGALAAIDRVLSGVSDGQTSPAEVVPALPAGGPVPVPVSRPAAPLEAAAPAPVAPAAPSSSPPSAKTGAETVRVTAENLDRLLRSTGQLLAESQRQELVGRELAGLGRQLEELTRGWESLRNTAEWRQLAAAPGWGRLAQFLHEVGHQLPALARQARAVRRLHRQVSWGQQLLGGQLRQDVRRVRLVSAESVFQGFRKMMRDLARSEGKEIDFRVSGLEVEADRMVLQALKDPLMHVLCNAISHGIESPDERRAQGKEVPAQVSLHLEVAGNRLHIRVEDDGRGIDYRKVAEVAVWRGLLSAEEAESLAPGELARFLFEPGFSTARVVTGLAGRGMGLSVVHETLARMQGEVEFGPRNGAGTALVLTVPLAVATRRLLLVACAGQTYAVPLHGIERLLRLRNAESGICNGKNRGLTPLARPSDSQLSTVEGRPVVLIEGQPVPVLSLAGLLGMGPREGTRRASEGTSPSARLPAEDREQEQALALVVLRAGGRRLAVEVDSFLGERDAFVQEVDDLVARVGTFAGGILLEDGSVALVLNPAELVKGTSSLKTSERGPGIHVLPGAPEKKVSTVLVVDDSLTTRTLEKSILEAHGYNVRIAVDGMEALARLRDEHVDLVITDIEMPRLDGFGLLGEMKRDGRLAQIPVIVVTSRERSEDRERGLALGADAYIVKRKFDHEDLLNTIRQLA